MRLKKGHLFCHLLLAPRRIGLVELFPLCDHLYNVVIFGIFYVPSVRTESTLPRVVDCVSTSFSVDVDGLASMLSFISSSAYPPSAMSLQTWATERKACVPKILPSLKMFVSAQLHKLQDCIILRLLPLTIEQ